ncbi:hypothetical protein EMIT0P74_90095 [Pseudomonas sp. IT-P74]
MRPNATARYPERLAIMGWPFFCMQENRHVQPASSGRIDLRKPHRENQLGRKTAAERA